MVHRTVVEMFKEYSQRLDFSYTDSLRDRLALLKETVVANHVLPHRLRDESAFDSVEKNLIGLMPRKAKRTAASIL